VLEIMGVPRDPRGIVLLCGYMAAAAFGVGALLSPGDPIGWAYIALAAMGYFFIQTRLVPTFLWLLVAAGGVAVALAGEPSGWVPFVLGLALALVALVPVPAVYRFPRTPSAGTPNPAHPAAVENGDSSRFLEQTGPTDISPPDSAGGRLTIRSIGQFRLMSAGRDLAPGLEDRPVLAFLFKYLFARLVLGDPQVGRTAIGDELSPGVPETSRRERLRKQLYDLQKDLAPPIAALVHTNRTHVWLELDVADSDIAHLRDLASRIRKRGFIIDAELAAEIGQVLDQTESQEFLAGFEDLENKVNQGRGTAGQVVAQGRELIASQRAELVRALAEYQDAMGHPELAIRHLQAALEALPARQDLARLLVVAYLKTGQTTRASELRREFALKQE
jgi:DNA-binding SARP family transcriptional activator